MYEPHHLSGESSGLYKTNPHDNGMTPQEYDLSKLRVEVFGTGRPLLMLHGWNRAGGDLKSLAALVAGDRTVHLVDLPGFGASPLPEQREVHSGVTSLGGESSVSSPMTESAWGTHEYGELMVRYLQSVGITSCDLLGHSFGGRICLRIASRYQSMVGSMVLIGSHGLQLPKPFKVAVKSRLLRTLRRIVRLVDTTFNTKLYTKKFVPFFGSRDYLNAGPLRAILVKTVNEDQSENVRWITAPTLLLWGALDTETPIAMGRRFQQLIGGARLISLDNHGHDPFQDVGAHLCAYHIESFLRRLDESGKEAL
jgi:pimeloyl-ACP methyl ester carboxylesterase